MADQVHYEVVLAAMGFVSTTGSATPALIITDEDNVIPEESEADSPTFALSGVTVTAIRSLGDAHDYVVLNGMNDKPVTRGAIALASATLRQELSR